MLEHRYSVLVEWAGNTGQGTTNYRSYERNHRIAVDGKPDLLGSSDPAFRGDPRRHNPEELLVAALSACHMLWYLHLCAEGGVVVVEYQDEASGVMSEDAEGGRFEHVVLRPRVTVAAPHMVEHATTLHADAHSRCFIARSVNFRISHEPEVAVEDARATP